MFLEEYYRVQFFTAIDVAILNLNTRFESTDLTKLERLCDVLLTGKLDRDISINYPELSVSELEIELPMYYRNYKRDNIAEHVKVFKEMKPEGKTLFPHIQKLLKIILVNPINSCEAERSFSALRRLKTWLRSTMTQHRLNHVLICHVHKNIVLKIPNEDIAAEFVKGSASRRQVFGS